MNRLQIAVHKTRQLLGVGVAMMLFPLIALSEAANSIAGRPGDYVPDEVLVKFKEATAIEARVQSIGTQLNRQLEVLDSAGLIRVKLKDGQGVEEALSAYRDDLNVEYVQPNYIYTLQALPDDPMFGQLWGLRNTGQTVSRNPAQPEAPRPTHNPGTPGSDMNMVSAWDVVTDCSSVIVGVIDSGINYNHEDLAANLWNDPAFPNHGFDFVNNTYDPMDTNGHGTHVAGTIGAVGNNGRGSTGVCWKAKLMALRACNTLGRCTSASEIAALNLAVARGAKVVNMSFGGPNLDQALSDAILRAGNGNVVVVVAAGNEGKDNNSGTTPTYPCNFPHPNLLCVAALDQAYDLPEFSNFGRVSVHVGAPGVNVVSTWAGAEMITTDNFHTGGILNWTRNPTTGGWAYGQRMLGDRRVDLLLNPGTFPDGTYRPNVDDRVYKQFSLSGHVATLSLAGQIDVAQGDFFRINIRNTAGDPFAPGGTRILEFSGSTGGVIAIPELDITRCIGPTCMVGFQLLSRPVPPPQRAGVGLLYFRIKTLQLNPVTYNVLAGTSMATPHVAGLAAMLRAFNPNYTVADVVTAIKSGGTPVAALVGKTATGKAVNALGSLTYINAPTGITAAVVH